MQNHEFNKRLFVRKQISNHIKFHNEQFDDDERFSFERQNDDDENDFEIFVERNESKKIIQNDFYRF